MREGTDRLELESVRVQQLVARCAPALLRAVFAVVPTACLLRRSPAYSLPVCLQDYIMQAADGEELEAELAAAELAAAQPRLMSKVVVPSPNVYDPRQVPP